MQFSDPSFLSGSERTVNSSDEQELIDNLHPGVTYSFTVTAFNQIGFGSESEALSVTTLDEGTVQDKLLVTCGEKHCLIFTDLSIFC